MRKLITGLVALAVFLPSVVALATQAVTVVQKGRAFSLRELTIPRGGAIGFTNEDDFAHQLNIVGPDMAVDSDMQEEGETVSVTFPHAGKFEVRCGIHPRMRLTVQVE